jgi:hypothetical protein
VDAIEMFKQQVAGHARTESGLGAALVGIGAFTLLRTVRRNRGGFFAWALPGSLIAAGAVMIAHVGLSARSARIAEAEDQITAELEGLDPVARAQVLRSVSEQQLRAIVPGLD